MKYVMLLTALLVAGCASQEHLPTVEWHSDREALDILAARAASVRTISSQGLLTMQRPDGQSVRLDLAMVRDNAGDVRLRAWKFGRAIFDFTMTQKSVWMVLPDDASLRQRLHDSQAGVTKLADTFHVIDGALFSRPDVKTDTSGKWLICSDTINEVRIRCEVDRQTLTPRKYTIFDPQGVARFTMELSKYREIDGIPFACKYVGTSDMGVITIALDDVELNTELAPAAFIPPRRAEKVR